jgi:hypothetical protein
MREARDQIRQIQIMSRRQAQLSVAIRRTTYPDTVLQLGKARKRVPRLVPAGRQYVLVGDEITILPLDKHGS